MALSQKSGQEQIWSQFLRDQTVEREERMGEEEEEEEEEKKKRSQAKGMETNLEYGF